MAARKQTKATTVESSTVADLGLAGTGFAAASVEIPPRMILSLQGDWFSGKSYFALSAPGPIAVLNIDNNLEGVLSQFPDKVILKADYRLDIKIEKGKATASGPQAEDLWERLINDYKRALESKVRTVVIDNATEFWEMARLARLGKLAQVLPTNYGPVNAEFRELMRRAGDADANLILVHKTKAEYINDKGTGKRIRAGFSDMEFITQVVGYTSRVKDPETGAESMQLEVGKCTLNRDVSGVKLQGEMFNFKTLAMMVFPEVDEGYWDGGTI